MKKITFLVLVLFQSLGMNAQTKLNPHTKLSFQKLPSGFVSELPLASPSVEGTYYYADEWQRTTLYLIDNGKLEDLMVKFNLREYNFEIQLEESVKVLPGRKVKFFEWTTEKGAIEEFVSARNYQFEDRPISGFFRVVQGGTYTLLSLMETEVLPASYNVALDVGNRNHQIRKKTTYFIAKENKIVKVTSNKKSLTRNFAQTFDQEIGPLIAELRINLRVEGDIKQLIARLNQ